MRTSSKKRVKKLCTISKGSARVLVDGLRARRLAGRLAHRTVLVFVPLPVLLGFLGGAGGDQRRVRLHPRVQRKQVLQGKNLFIFTPSDVRPSRESYLDVGRIARDVCAGHDWSFNWSGYTRLVG